MKVQGQIGLKPGEGGAARRAVTWLVIVAPGLAVYACLEDYMVRELFLFVALAALLVFFGLSVAVLSLLFHWAGQGLVCFVRGVKSRMARPRQVAAEGHAGALVGGLHDEHSAIRRHLG